MYSFLFIKIIRIYINSIIIVLEHLKTKLNTNWFTIKYKNIMNTFQKKIFIETINTRTYMYVPKLDRELTTCSSLSHYFCEFCILTRTRITSVYLLRVLSAITKTFSCFADFKTFYF